MLCLVATLVMVSPYQGKVNGILTLAGQQTKKPEYDTKKTPLPLHAVLRAWRGRLFTVRSCVVWSLALFLFISERGMRGGLL